MSDLSEDRAVQSIVTPGGERLVVIPEADYERLLAASDDLSDAKAYDTFRQKLATGDEELLPADIVKRFLAGENRIRIWREHRQLTAAVLAERADIAQPFLSQLETGKHYGTVETMRKLAAALSITIDDLVG